MYHLPRGRLWNPQLLVEALQKHGVKATRDGERVAMTLVVERINFLDVLNAQTADDLRSALIAEIVGVIPATLSFAPTAVFENILFEFAQNLETGCYPRTTDVTDALLECGYVTLNHREIANKYYTGEIDLNALFDRIEKLQIEKLRAVDEHRFDDATDIYQKERMVKQQIEDLLRNSMQNE